MPSVAGVFQHLKKISGLNCLSSIQLKLGPAELTSPELERKLTTLNLKNLLAWFGERFPLINFITAFVMYAMVAAVAASLGGKGAHVFDFRDLVGALNLSFYFLVLRILDEHKDFKTDLENFPKRVLQSGRIKLSQLRVIAVACAVFQIFSCLFLDQGLGAATCSLVGLSVVALLMFKEFFVSGWLKKHMMVYGLLHLLSAPAMAFWVIAMALPELAIGWVRESAGGPGYLPLLFLPFCAGMVFELVRKSFGAEEEKPNLESYSRVFGAPKMTLFIAGFMIATLGVQWTLLRALGADIHLPLARWLPVVGFFLGLTSLLLYAKRPTKKLRKMNEATTGTFILGSYILLLVISLEH